MPELVTLSDSDEISSSADEMERRWIRTKDYPESIGTKTQRIALEKKRRMVRDRIDEKKRMRLLKVARENEQESGERKIRLISDNGCEQCAPCGHGMSTCASNTYADSLSRAILLSSTPAPEIQLCPLRQYPLPEFPRHLLSLTRK
jgi:ferredoxin